MGEASALTGRAEQMARSLRAALTARGHGRDDRDTILQAFSLAMKPRIAELPDDHHPAWLHPARSVLILLHDATGVDPVTLIVAALHDSLDTRLRVAPDEIERRFGSRPARGLESIPLPGDEQLLERLLLLGPELALAALAEQLDQLRHLHLREDLVDDWTGLHSETSAAWIPFAARINPALHRRYQHWGRVFGRRLERRTDDPL